MLKNCTQMNTFSWKLFHNAIFYSTRICFSIALWCENKSSNFSILSRFRVENHHNNEKFPSTFFLLLITAIFNWFLFFFFHFSFFYWDMSDEALISINIIAVVIKMKKVFPSFLHPFSLSDNDFCHCLVLIEKFSS